MRYCGPLFQGDVALFRQSSPLKISTELNDSVFAFTHKQTCDTTATSGRGSEWEGETERKGEGGGREENEREGERER